MDSTLGTTPYVRLRAGFDQTAVFLLTNTLEIEAIRRDSDDRILANVLRALVKDPRHALEKLANVCNINLAQLYRMLPTDALVPSRWLTLQSRDRLRIDTLISLVQEVASGKYLPASTPCVFFAGERVLLLPPSTSVIDARRAVKLLVGGLQPPWRLRSYAYAATAGVNSVIGDWPDAGADELIEKAEALATHISLPVTIGLEPMTTVKVNGRSLSQQLSVGPLSVVQDLCMSQLPFKSLTLHCARARASMPNLRFLRKGPLFGGSVDLSKQSAAMRAYAEAIERFAAGHIPRGRFIVERACDLPLPFLDPGEVIRFSDVQYARNPQLQPFSPNEPNAWVLGENVITREPVYVLAEQVFYPFSTPISGRKAIQSFANSSGVAAGNSRLECLQRAYLELIERDAFLSIWLGRTTLRTLRLKSLPDTNRIIIDELQKLGYEMALLAPSNVDGCPILIAVADGPQGLLVGAAAGARESVITKALCEVLDLAFTVPKKGPILPEHVTSPADHVQLYFGQAARSQARFLFRDGERVSFKELANFYHVELPKTAVGVDLTSEYTEPLVIWRCLAPGLIPMTFGYDREPLGLPKAVRLIKATGIDLVQPLFPHPFA